MRAYNRHSIKRAAERIAEQRTETMDAICWEVLDTDRMVRVKIQGSAEYVLARWPSNWQTRPNWLRPGQAVRLLHRGGIRGLLEVTGFGLTIPTPVSGATTPAAETPVNSIISGLQLFQRPHGATMMVWLSGGTARFSGAIITALGATMTDAITMDDGLVLGNVSGAWTLTAPSAGQYRMILFTIDSTGLVRKREGDAFSTVYTEPTVPAGELVCARLFLRGGATSITQADIGQAWSAPTASNLTITATDTSAGAQESYDLVLAVTDQFGNAILNGFGWRFKITLTDGDGTLSDGIGGTATEGNTLEKTVYLSNSATFSYAKGATDVYAMFSAALVYGEVNLNASAFVTIGQTHE